MNFFGILFFAFICLATSAVASSPIYEDHLEGVLRIESTPDCGALEIGSEDVIFQGCQYTASIFRPELWPLRMIVLVADRYQAKLADGDLLDAELNRIQVAGQRNIYIATLRTPVDRIKYSKPKLANFSCSTGIVAPYTNIAVNGALATVVSVSSPLDEEPHSTQHFNLDLEQTIDFALYTGKDGNFHFQLKVPFNRPVPLFDAARTLSGFGFSAVYNGYYIPCR